MAENIQKDFLGAKISEENFYDGLKALIYGSFKDQTRLKAIQAFRKVALNSSWKGFFEELVLSESNDLIKFEAARLLVDLCIETRASSDIIYWLIKNESNGEIVQAIYYHIILHDKEDSIFGIRDFLSELYGLVLEEIEFVIDLLYTPRRFKEFCVRHIYQLDEWNGCVVRRRHIIAISLQEVELLYNKKILKLSRLRYLWLRFCWKPLPKHLSKLKILFFEVAGEFIDNGFRWEEMDSLIELQILTQTPMLCITFSLVRLLKKKFMPFYLKRGIHHCDALRFSILEVFGGILGQRHFLSKAEIKYSEDPYYKLDEEGNIIDVSSYYHCSRGLSYLKLFKNSGFNSVFEE